MRRRGPRLLGLLLVAVGVALVLWGSDVAVSATLAGDTSGRGFGLLLVVVGTIVVCVRFMLT